MPTTGNFTAPPTCKWLGLHAKAMIFDQSKVYVGIMNLDPRSVIQNTEVGLLLQSEALASQLQAAFDHDPSARIVWRLTLDENGRVSWESSAGARSTPPARSFWQRVQDWLLPARLIEEQI